MTHETYGHTKIAKLRAAVNALRAAIRSESLSRLSGGEGFRFSKKKNEFRGLRADPAANHIFKQQR
ncbi:hypothetical protein [Marivita sp.]|uniref:hypothetical protein n=1 Tax=Marivita sp. TaxID=2003365 RepID=UPI0025B7B3AE|nr:hypothetical protein [Marivita sp.]